MKTEPKSKLELLEETGYSYSGVADIIHNEPEQAKDLLQQMEAGYQDVTERQRKLLEQLEQLQFLRSGIASCFVYAHKALALGESPLSFMTESGLVRVKILDYESRQIEHEVFPITFK